MSLPGIPPSGTVEAASFSAAFWTNLYSGVISGLFTGITVGIAIWVVQLFVDNRRAKKMHERELEMLRGSLRSALSTPNTLCIQSAIGCEPTSSRVVTELLEKNPINSWKRSMPTHPVFPLIAQFAEARMEFITRAGALDSALNEVIRLHNASRGVISPNDPAYKSYFFGRLHGLSDDRILAHIDRTESSLGGLQQAFLTVSEHERIEPLVQPFLSARQRLVRVVENFCNC